MIITLTLNPALDKTATIDPLVPGGLNRIQKSELDAGGKGINVSKLLNTLGGKSIATGFVGGSTGGALLRMLDDLGLTHDFVHVQSTTRINLKLLDTVNGVTEVNDPGVVVTNEEEEALLQKLFAFIATSTTEKNDAGKANTCLFVLAGSMHSGARPSFYKELTHSLKEKGARVFVDADGKAFAEALLASPDFVKPNKEELLRHFGRDSAAAVTHDELIALCKKLIDEHGVGLVALSLGAEGAIFVNKEQCIVAPVLSVDVSSTVGAGDSMVGAVAHAFAQNYSFEETVRLAMACSAGAVTTKGTKAPSLACINTLLQQVTLEYR